MQKASKLSLFKLSPTAVPMAMLLAMASVGASAQVNVLGDKDKAAMPAQCTGVSAECVAAAVKAAQPARKKAKSGPAPLTVAGVPEAKPGECYARIYYPEQTTTDTQQVLKRAASSRLEIVPGQVAEDEEEVVVRQASKRLEVTPATYKTVSETVEVRPASKRVEVVPATYKTETEEIIVKPAMKRLVVVPGGFDTVEEKVLVTPARSVWKRGVNIAGLPTKQDASGEVLCLVEEPAVYKAVSKKVKKPDTTREMEIPAVTKTVTRTVVDKPATTREIEIPAVTQTLTKTVLDKPASTREVEIPEVRQKVKVLKEVSPPKENVVQIPAEYETISKTSVVRPGGWEWKSVLCETNATPAKINEINSALDKSGHKASGGGLQGTLTALNSYRKAKNLPTDNYITVDTLKALGVSAK